MLIQFLPWFRRYGDGQSRRDEGSRRLWSDVGFFYEAMSPILLTKYIISVFGNQELPYFANETRE